MINLKRIEIPIEKLSTIPEDQRRFFIYGGHIYNELYFFSRLLRVFQQTGSGFIDTIGFQIPSDEALRAANSVQSIIAIKLFAGKLCETHKFLKKWCFNEPWFKEMLEQYANDVRLKNHLEIENYFSQPLEGQRSCLLKLIRNKYAFHYDPKAVEKIGEAVNSIDEFIWYAREDDANLLCVGSEHSILESLFIQTGISTREQMLGDAIDDCLKLTDLIQDFSDSVMTHIFEDYLLDHARCEAIKVDPIRFEDIRLPFFTEK